MKTKRTKRTKQISSKPVKKRGRPRKTTKKTGGQSSFLQKYTVNVIGGVVAILALLGLFQAGIVGTLMINIAKLFVGSLYPVFLLVGIVVGVFLAGFSRFPKIPAKYTWGTVLILLGVLLWLTLIEYIQAAQPVDFINFNWQKLVDDVVSSNSDSNIGGGILATIVFYLAHVLFGKIGTGIVASLIILIGGFILFDISFAKIFTGLRTCLTFIKTRAAAIRQQTDQKRPKKPTKQPSPSTAANHPQTVEQPQNDDSEPNKLSASAITISGMPVSDEAKQSSKPATKPTPPKESEKADDSADVNLVDVKEDDAYKLPTTDLLTQIPQDDQSSELQSIDHNAQVLQKTLDSFGVKAEIKHVSLGPSVTKYELHPDIGVKVSRIVNLADDIALALAAKDIRIEAPIPGKSLIGIEVPNRKIATVSFRDVVEHQPDNHGHVLQVPLGKDVNGNVITADLTKMPHLLIAGSTGSGKSVAINGIITSILLHAKPSQVKLMLIDPKKVELGVYNGIPHLLSPVVSEPKKAARALQKVVSEMENRYELFAKFGQRKISTYNDFVAKNNRENDTKIQPMPYIVVIVDELADLMMTVSNDVEAAIIRLAQMGRAAGIHMILATQRPSVDVITGLIKANVPSRIAFAVSSGIDSRTIIDTNGAEKLLGRGDMLFLPIDSNTPIRVQGAFIPDKDVSRVVKFITDQQSADYDESMMVSDEEIKEEDQEDSEDDLFNDALAFVVDQQKASTSLLQRHFRIGYNRAARLIDDLEKRGYIGPQDGSRPRQVYKEKQE